MLSAAPPEQSWYAVDTLKQKEIIWPRMLSKALETAEMQQRKQQAAALF